MILIVGATGYLGGIDHASVARAGPAGARAGAPRLDYRPLVEAGAAPALGDLRQRDTLDVACRGVDTVITTAIARLDVDPATAQATNLDGYLNLIDAAKAAGVKRFIFTSVLGSDPDSPAPLWRRRAKSSRACGRAGSPTPS